MPENSEQSLPPQLPSATPAEELRSDPETDPLQVLLQASAAAQALQSRFSELRAQQAGILEERAQFTADREAFEELTREFAEQVAHERNAQREARAELDERTRRLKQQEASVEFANAELKKSRERLSLERERISSEAAEEIDQVKQLVQVQRAALDEQRADLTKRSEQLEAQHSARLKQVDEAMQAEREEMRECVRQELAKELDEVNRQKHEWQQQRDSQQREMQEQAEELQQQREQFGAQIEAERTRLQVEVEKHRRMLQTEQNNLQRRYRFQFEHLGRSRDDFETDLREFRQQQQRFRTERRQFDEQHRLRFRQLRRIRALLLDRAASLAREQKVLDRTRTSLELDAKRQRERLKEHQDAVMQDLQSRTRETQHREESVARAMAQMDERTHHLNHLRSEIEETQRDVLEQRLILEEVQVILKRKATSAEIQTHTDHARAALKQFFDHLQQNLDGERQRLDEKRKKLFEEQQQFRVDREELEQWFRAREQELNVIPVSAVQPDTDEVAHRLTSELSDLRKQWHLERRESEAKIRGLLDQLAEVESRNFQSEPVLVAETVSESQNITSDDAPDRQDAA